MTDRELLEAAAKAAGHVLVDEQDDDGFGGLMIEPPHHDMGALHWNPLHDDGDALRLAVALRITPHIDGNMTEAEYSAGFSTEAHLGDPYAATRRAIVRAAAEIGRLM